MAEIVDLAARRLAADVVVIPGLAVATPSRGNGAREAVIDIALHLPADARLEEAAAWSDWLLSELWSRGFKVMPVEVA